MGIYIRLFRIFFLFLWREIKKELSLHLLNDVIILEGLYWLNQIFVGVMTPVYAPESIHKSIHPSSSTSSENVPLLTLSWLPKIGFFFFLPILLKFPLIYSFCYHIFFKRKYRTRNYININYNWLIYKQNYIIYGKIYLFIKYDNYRVFAGVFAGVFFKEIWLRV